jgi:hypothetical protein
LAQWFAQHSVLFPKVVDQLELLLVHPAGHCDQQEPERVPGSPAMHGPVGDPLQIYADRFSGHYAIRTMQRIGTTWQASPFARSHSMRNGYTDAVYHKSTDEVLHDNGATTTGDAQGVNEFGEITSNEDDICALFRHIGARAHRDSDTCLDQGRRVIDSIANHRDVTVLCSQFASPFCFLLGQEFPNLLVNAEVMSNRRRNTLRISAQENYLQAHFSQSCDRSLGFGPEDIGNADTPQHSPFSSHKDL